MAAGLAPEQIDGGLVRLLPQYHGICRTRTSWSALPARCGYRTSSIWQAAYAEYYFTPVYWPDFGVEEVDRALEAFAQRGRRFGGLSEAPKLNGSKNGKTPHAGQSLG